jgi:hypothetical protein
VEFPVPCWRRHSDSSLSPFVHPPGASLIFSFSRGTGTVRSDLGGGAVVAVAVAASCGRSFFPGKGRRRYDAIGQCAFCAFWGDLQGCLPVPEHIQSGVVAEQNTEQNIKEQRFVSRVGVFLYICHPYEGSGRPRTTINGSCSSTCQWHMFWCPP